MGIVTKHELSFKDTRTSLGNTEKPGAELQTGLLLMLQFPQPNESFFSIRLNCCPSHYHKVLERTVPTLLLAEWKDLVKEIMRLKDLMTHTLWLDLAASLKIYLTFADNAFG